MVGRGLAGSSKQVYWWWHVTAGVGVLQSPGCQGNAPMHSQRSVDVHDLWSGCIVCCELVESSCNTSAPSREVEWGMLLGMQCGSGKTVVETTRFEPSFIVISMFHTHNIMS